MEEYVISRIRESIEAKENMLKLGVEDIVCVADEIIDAYRKGKKLVLFGNGGSASQCSHIAAEFAVKYEIKKRPGLEAIALNTDISAITAAGNDFGYEHIFERQVESVVKPGDVVIGLSTSGNSKNVLFGLKKAKDIGAVTVALVGNKGLYNASNIFGYYTERKRKMVEDSTADYVLKIPSSRTSVIQEAHIMVGHILCDLVEKELYGKK